jgi:hypothetical protein
VIYEPLNLGQPGEPKCPDKFNAESTRMVPRCKKLFLQISANAVVVQLGVMPQGISQSAGAVEWQAEEVFLPMIASLTRDFDAIRVRNYQAGIEGQILASFY